MKTKMYLKRMICNVLILSLFYFSGCNHVQNEVSDTSESVIEDNTDIWEETSIEEDNNEVLESKVETPSKNKDELELINVPTKEEVLSMREKVLEGMSSEEIARLMENIKVANQTMEHAYFYENLFGKLEDPQHLYWNYIDQKGDIQIGWEEDGTPLMTYNRFHADNFIILMAEMRDSLKCDLLVKDFNNLIQYTQLAKDTHRVEYVERVYCILHDMDYFLLRYGIEDVGKYLEDLSTVEKYYGALEIYGGAGLTSIPTPAYLTDISDEVYRNLITQLIETQMREFGWMPHGVYYAIMDIDGDGREELIIKGAEESTAALATMAYYIYDYNRTTKEVYIERLGWPNMTFYDNGYVREEASRNQGLSEMDDFWPYHLLVYNLEKDCYEDVAMIDAWQRERYPENFPEEKDKDGDGIVYYTSNIMFDTPTEFMDQEEYDTWCEQYNTGKPKEIHWKAIMTLEEYVAIYMKDAVG